MTDYFAAAPTAFGLIRSTLRPLNGAVLDFLARE